MTTIAIGADHAGFAVKELLKDMLAQENYQVVDVGTKTEESCDYPDFAHKVATMVAQQQADRGILICGTGIGMSISANKTRGVRAALCFNEETAEMSRRHNNSNVLCLGARSLPATKLQQLTHLWLNTDFDGGRHQRRVDKMELGC